MSYIIRIRGEKTERYIDDEQGLNLKEVVMKASKDDWVTIGDDQIRAGTITGIVYEPTPEYRKPSQTLADPKYRDRTPNEQEGMDKIVANTTEWLRDKGIVK